MKQALFTLAVPAVLLAQGNVKPMWVNQLPSAPGRVYAMGMAILTSTEAGAIRQAQNNARGEVLARLRASVKATTDTRTSSVVQRSTGGPTTGSSTQTYNQNVSVTAQATELPGLTVEETWTDTKQNTVYALAYLDVVAAHTELSKRFEAQRTDLASETAEGVARERLRKLQRMRAAQAEMAKLDDMAGLLVAAGGDAALRGEVRAQRLAVDKLLDQLKASLTFCVGGDRDLGVGGDVASALRNAVLKAGLGWAEQDGEFTLVLRFQGNRQGVDIKAKKQWWEHKYDADFIVARGILDVTLTDRAGTQYESTQIEAKGVATNEMQADKKMLDDYKKKLTGFVEKWLKEITQ